MLHTRRSFTVPATGRANFEMCAEKGHSAPDAKGRCLCCGEPVTTKVVIVDDVGMTRKTGPSDAQVDALVNRLHTIGDTIEGLSPITRNPAIVAGRGE